MEENERYLTKQLLTYLGNKRKLLPEIESKVIEIQKEIGNPKTINVDLFSGTGSVARLFKKYSSLVVANDFEPYSSVENNLFLSNKKDFDFDLYKNELSQLNDMILRQPYGQGIISANYAPKDTRNVQVGERAFYTHENAVAIDTARQYIATVKDQAIRNGLLAELLIQASIHSNTSGVFKGFYKNSKTKIGEFGGNGHNALSRITGKIELENPELSNNESDYLVYIGNANTFFSDHSISADITYLDPPYNQHPYGSNYFMLNEIIENKLLGTLSPVSGIPAGWQHSDYNVKSKIKETFSSLIKSLKTRYVIVSYNNEGFLSFDDIYEILSTNGKVLSADEIKYNTFRGSRNLASRNEHTKEYLFVAKLK